MTEQQDSKQATSLLEAVKRLTVMHLEDLKLTATEKLTLLISGIALFTVLMVLIVIALIFLAIGIANLLESIIAPFWTYFIIAGLLMIVMIVIVLLKDQLIVDPIARFISRLILNPNKK